jgi:hypothetical protein
MQKTLAVLATVVALAATAVAAPAPAQARGIGPGLAFGLAAGALAAGAYGAYGPYYGYGYGPRLWLWSPLLRIRLRQALRLLRRTVLSPPLLPTLVTDQQKKPGARSGLFLVGVRHEQNGGRSTARRARSE